MEEVARDILRRAVSEAAMPKDSGRAVHARFLDGLAKRRVLPEDATKEEPDERAHRLVKVVVSGAGTRPAQRKPNEGR